MNQTDTQKAYETLVGTNLELFGSDLEYKIKELAAQAEAEWTQLDLSRDALHIWRIEKFHLKKRADELSGSFYEGDSYVCLRVKKEGDQTTFTIHFWLGSQTSTDEMCVAAYKTVELDNYLKGRAVQYREVQFSESNLFRSYFPHLAYLSGGIDSGFRIIRDNYFDGFVPNLVRIHDKRYLHVQLNSDSLTSDDVYVLDVGSEFYVYVGPDSTHQEKYVSEILIQSVRTIRGSKLKVIQRDADLSIIRAKINSVVKN